MKSARKMTTLVQISIYIELQVAISSNKENLVALKSKKIVCFQFGHSEASVGAGYRGKQRVSFQQISSLQSTPLLLWVSIFRPLTFLLHSLRVD